jgi:rhodanese-related sulfurtransferase
LAQSLRVAWPDIVFNAVEYALPTTLNFSVPGVPSSVLVDVLDAAGVRVSAGSACSAKKAAPSYVLQAMGLPEWQAASAVRLSFGALADAAFIDAACARIVRCGAALRLQRPPVEMLPDETLEPLRLGPALAEDPACSLPPAALAEFWRQHPDALLVDVREAHEHAADTQLQRFGRAASNIPLAELTSSLAVWLRQPRPVLLFCRTGRRSSQALQRLRQLGYAQAWQVAGGVVAAAGDLL